MSEGRFGVRVADLLAEAEALAREEDWDAVRGLAQAALALAPGNADAQRLVEQAAGGVPSGGERRQLTVMFCDVVGSTSLSQAHDPELVREVLRAYQATSDEAVRRYDGRIARYIGDGILAYFGHPVAHEDDARRAVKAGLDLLDALRPVTEEVRQRYEIELAIRVAVHTGVVVLADMGSAITPDRDAIVGETPNLAARLQDHAQPGSLVISQDTYELVRGWFLAAPLGPVVLKGIAEPVHAYQVVEETSMESRVQAQADLSPFVGREGHVAELHAAWDEVRAGGHRTVALTGQAGVGKSRLADLLRRRVLLDDGGALIANCSTYHGTTALHPVRRLLERAAGIDTRQDAERALPRLWSVMEAVGQADAVPLLAELLEIPPTPWCPAPELDGSRLHDAVLGTLVDFVAASAARSPLLLVVDDVQWADPSTIALVGRIIAARVPGVLLVLTARDGFVVPWPSAQQLAVDRLSVEELDELAQRLPEGRRLDRADLDRAIERSDGIPFFLEELLRSSVLARGEGDRTGGNIPAVLRDHLLARFAAPGVDLHVAQLIATIGGEATVPVIAATLGRGASDVDRLLDPMVDAGILVVDGEPATYRFRHHLLADLAYDTQLRPARERAHSAVADALRSGASVGVAAAPAAIAHHLEQAGRTAEAVEALVEAAEAALSLGANTEVATLLADALELVASVEEDRREDLEFEVRIVRGISVSSQLGYSAPQAIADFEACQALVEGVTVEGYIDELSEEEARRPFELVASRSALWANQLLQGRLEEADAVNNSTLARFRPGGQAYLITRAAGHGFSHFFRGAYLDTLPLLEELTQLGQEYQLPGRNPMPNDSAASAYAHLSFALAVRGRLDEARHASDAGLRVAEKVAFPVGPFSSCYVLGMRAAIELSMGDPGEAGRFAAQQAEIADRHGFTFWALMSALYEATVDFAEGDEAAGQRAVMTAMMARAMGVLVWMPSFLAAISATHLRRGDADQAAALLADATQVADDTGAHYWSAELTRQQGEVALARGDASGPELLRRAVALAVDQGAVIHELWARTSLCRCSKDPDDRAALEQLLAALTLPADAPDRLAAESVLAGRS